MKICFLLVAILLFSGNLILNAEDVPQYNVHELVFTGKSYQLKDNPVKDIELKVTWAHTLTWTKYTVYGFYDGDGKGQPEGNVFKIRFCPVMEGEWKIMESVSNDEQLNGQNVGYTVNCIASENEGFWLVPEENPLKRWYQRSSGNYQYIVGNTMYNFLSGYVRGVPTNNNITKDVENCGEYYKKIRFAISSGLYPNPDEKPFIDDTGKPTDDGDYSCHPNASWFYNRVDQAVQTANRKDIIADLILAGLDSENSQSVFRAAANGGDCTPFLRYVAARYGSYPNVWICMANEYDARTPTYSPEAIKKWGFLLKKYLAYPTPLSVHGDQGNWREELNSETLEWNDHVIIQNKIKNLQVASEYEVLNYHLGKGNKPIINDELAYQGAWDGWLEEDVIEAVLGAFVGGGYASTGYKPENKRGQYVVGIFNAEEHSASDNLKWMREQIDKNISFWKMSPAFYTSATYVPGMKGGRCSIFKNLHPDFRAMEWNKNEYVLATNHAYKDIQANLPAGRWKVTSYNCINKEMKVIAESAEGTFSFDSPESRAVLFHLEKNQE